MATYGSLVFKRENMLFHKRAGDLSIAWCGQKIDGVEHRETYWWKKVTCPNCLQTKIITPKKKEKRAKRMRRIRYKIEFKKAIEGENMVRKIHKLVHGEERTWCGEDGLKHNRWEHVTCKECLKHKVIRIKVGRTSPPLRVEDIDMTKLRNFFNK